MNDSEKSLIVATAAKCGLENALAVAAEMDSRQSDALLDDLIERLTACVGKLDAEVTHYRSAAGREAPSARVLRLVP